MECGFVDRLAAAVVGAGEAVTAPPALAFAAAEIWTAWWALLMSAW
jgi:hypothetical protein